MMEKYLNAALSPEERAEDLLGKMSLEEKMGQVNCVFPFSGMMDLVKKTIQKSHGIGQISTLHMRMSNSLEEAAAWQRDLQKTAMEASEHHIPAVFHMEGLSGAFIPDAVSFPSGIARGSSWNPELERKIAQVVGKEETACGVTQTFAPVLDISRDSRMGRQGETYGEDPALASAMGAAYTKGVQEVSEGGRKTDATAKHFVGFHDSEGGIHTAHSNVTPRLVREIYGRPFQAAMTEGNLKGIMPCYCSMDGEPASASEELLTGLLREEMGFDGVCVSDYCGVSHVHSIHHVGETMADAGLLCMKAGMDVELPMSDGYSDGLKEMFAEGKADIEILNRAVYRILTAKFRMGLFEHPFALEGEELQKGFFTGEEAELTMESAREGIILLKNDGTLPIRKNCKKILVVGPHAAQPRFYFGGYTHISMVESVYAAKDTMAGVDDGREEVDDAQIRKVPGTKIQLDEEKVFDDVLKKVKPECRSILEVLKEKLPNTEIVYAKGYEIAGDNLVGAEEVLKLAEGADLILVTLGGKYGTGSIASMGEGIDATDINLPKCQDDFIQKAAELGIPMVGVHFGGRPVSSDAADEKLNALAEAWTLSEASAEAVGEVLTGEYNPSGKLPVCVAYNAGQIPIYYNHPWGTAWHLAESIGFPDYVDCPHTPRYFFGHGLSYTSYEYKALKINQKETRPDMPVEISFKVKNTGKYAGTEIAQLYIRDIYASQTRPVKELAGFKRVLLNPGEEKKVVFTLHPSQMAFLDRDMKWKIEKGEIQVEIGSSSEDIRLKDAFQITEDAWINGKKRAFYTMGEVTTA